MWTWFLKARDQSLAFVCVIKSEVFQPGSGTDLEYRRSNTEANQTRPFSSLLFYK